jgi:hypothetical protein
VIEAQVTTDADTLDVPAEDPPFDPGITDDDATNMLTAWIRNLSDDEARQVIQFADLDRRHRFQPGTARRVIERAAAPTSYKPESMTDRTMLLKWETRVRGGLSVKRSPFGF